MVQDFKNDLLIYSPSFICSKWILERTPFIFDNDMSSFIQWKEELGDKIEVDPKSIILTGSASSGFSLNPYKNYKSFDDSSDLDIAIISQFHFDIAWRTLRNLGTKWYDLSDKQKNSFDDHVTKYIYWGTIATDRLLTVFPFGKKWSFKLQEMSLKQPANNRPLKIRLYKDYDSLRAYHVNNIKNLRISLF